MSDTTTQGTTSEGTAAGCPFHQPAEEPAPQGASAAVGPAPGGDPTDGREAPVAEWVTLDDLFRDPFPIYRRLRDEAPVHWVPAVNRYLVTSYAACHTIEQDEAVYSADEKDSLMKRAMGHSMLRKDNPEHQTDRDSYGKTLRPGTIKQHWNAVFERNYGACLDRLRQAGPGADFVWEFAAPYAAENLRLVMGFHNASQEDMQRWSQTMIDGTGNYADDPEVWAKSSRSSEEVDAAIDEMLPYLRQNPDHSLLSGLASLPIPLEAIRANMKMTIGGGLNEPRDVLATTLWALLRDPEQRAAVEADPSLHAAAFEESVRWVAPIGMYPRQVAQDTVLEGIRLRRGDRVGVVIGAANRDPKVFERPESFDLTRPKKPHLAFGGGVHFCAGTWVARAQVAQIAMPRLFGDLPGLRLDESKPTVAGGWVFRGMLELPVRWN
ncbi:cytochrome P450 [Zhihengliuella somnathii]